MVGTPSGIFGLHPQGLILITKDTHGIVPKGGNDENKLLDFWLLNFRNKNEEYKTSIKGGNFPKRQLWKTI